MAVRSYVLDIKNDCQTLWLHQQYYFHLRHTRLGYNSLVTCLQARQTGIQIPVEEETVSSLSIFRLALVPTQASSKGTRVFSWWQSSQRVMTTHLHLTLRFTLSGAIFLLPLPSWHVWINFTFNLEMQVKNSFLYNN